MKHAKFAALAAALAALPVQAELLNPGADMELGETGKPVPGWMLTLNRIDRKLLRTQPDTFFTTETVMEKGRGRVLLVPYRPGMYDLSLVCGEMKVPADGEVEVAFDAKAGKPVGADRPNISLGADFRCYAPLNFIPDPKWSHPSYPLLSWLSADPARRQGYLTDAVLHSYWGTDYEANYARLSSLVDSVLGDVLCYDGAAAGTSYFALSNGRTEASENVWGSALPYLVPVDSSTDLSADNYEVTLTLSAPQVQQLLSSGLGIAADSAAPERWFGETTLTASGYAASLPVCGQTVSGTALRRALGLRSACFNIRYQDGSFLITTKGYGHGVGLSQWGAKALAEQGWTYEAILTHYFPGTQLCR